ncbi:MAG: HIT family protein [Deltaproteobacteria bacterium]|nr:HIT family protein [Deltaproteobacteria bacterium]
MENSFILDPRLEGDTLEVTDLRLCRVRLMNDRDVPWLILVPRRSGVVELFDLSADERAQLMEETTLAARALSRLHKPDKVNLGALGNMVRQFHVHIIARYQTDRAWPGAIWNTGPATPYDSATAAGMLDALRAELARG